MSTVLGFASRAVASAASCVFGCFRSTDSQYRNIFSTDDALMENQNAFSDLFVSDGDSVGDDEERWNLLFEGFDFRELRDEAMFLKACGTIPETPVEIRKASKEWQSAESSKGKSSSFKSWFPTVPVEKLNLENEAYESPTGAESLVDGPNPNSCMIEDHNLRVDSESSIETIRDQNVMTPTYTRDSETRRSEDSSVSAGAFHTSVQRTQKSVRFEFESDSSAFSSEGLSSDSSSQRSDQSGSAGYKSALKASPYPTPLKLSDEMQTPGTVFPGYSNYRNDDGKTNRVRSQYVYSVPNPSRWKEVNSEISNLAPLKELEANDEDGSSEQLGSTVDESVYSGKTPRDRPILEVLPINLNDETLHTSTKLWDGNGIPNTTTKYKEDSKVSWHETPFEKRLEKALYETAILQQNPIIGTRPVEFDGAEETDKPQTESPANI